MIGLHRPNAVRAMDERAMARGATPAGLMALAAAQLAHAVLELGGRGYGLRVGLLCGKGSNGGDGIAAARRLLRAGASPRVWLAGDADELGAQTRAELVAYRAAGGRVAASLSEALAGADVAVDCLLGTGATGAPRGACAEAVRALGAQAAPVLACDVPTGVDADDGTVADPAVRAAVTLTIGAHKRGLHLWPARGHCGRIVLAEIGIDDGAVQPVAGVLEAADVAALLPPPPTAAEKRDLGVLVAFAGSAGMSGAATLVGRGALAGGAGLVVLAVPEAVAAQVAPAVPEALTVALPDDPDAAFAQLADQVASADALAIGPGLGHDPATTALVRRLVRECAVPLVVDADGLNAFRDRGDELSDHAAPLLVLTPHRRELARIAGEAEATLWPRRAEAVPALAADWGAAVVAKGAGCLVAAPDGRQWVNPTGSPALATGGTGDVLTGLLGALVAQRPDVDAVAAGVWLHGLAGELAAAARGARSATASDVAAAIPVACRTLEER